MSRFTLRACDPATGQAVDHPLPLEADGSSCTLRMASVPGASAIQVIVSEETSEETSVRLVAEVEGDDTSPVLLTLSRTPDGGVQASAGERKLLTLDPRRSRERLPRQVLLGADALDVVVLVDGSTLFWWEQGKEAGLRPLLGDKKRWGDHVNQITEFLSDVARDHGSLRWSLLWFGDRPPPRVTADNLKPRYFVEPPVGRRMFHQATVLELGTALEAIKPSSGGDFVDALADALSACRLLGWRADARKLVLLTGDSPGYSVLHPSPPGADIGGRELDVDAEADGLFEHGIELATIHHHPPAESGLHDKYSDLLEFARDQYVRIASRRKLAFDATSFVPLDAAQAFHQSPPILGRNASTGFVVLTAPGQGGTAR